MTIKELQQFLETIPSELQNTQLRDVWIDAEEAITALQWIDSSGKLSIRTLYDRCNIEKDKANSI